MVIKKSRGFNVGTTFHVKLSLDLGNKKSPIWRLLLIFVPKRVIFPTKYNDFIPSFVANPNKLDFNIKIHKNIHDPYF